MKTSTVIAIGLIGVAGYALWDRNPEEVQALHLKQCIAEHGAEIIAGVNKYSSEAKCRFTEEYEEAQKAKKEQEKILAEAKAAEEKRIAEEKKAEEKRIAEAAAEAFRNSPEGKTKAFMTTASTLCRQDVRARAKFPNKVDFNWLEGNGSKYWMNFSEGKSRVAIWVAGEMMNGLGMMVPFKATCKYDYDPKAHTYSTVEILI
tara:strand:+ start:92 stop:700 length:609 start_codon:yes stop_codon:yes gene_type:complete